MSSRQVVKVEHKVSVAAFTSRDEKCVGQVTFIYIAPLTIQIVTKHCTISK